MDSCRIFKSFQHVQHADATASPKVNRGKGGFVLEKMRDRLGVCFGKVHHVNVISDASAVRSGIVISEDAHQGLASGGYLCHIGEEIVGDARWILPDESARVCANGVEIAQARDSPVIVACVQALKGLLNGKLCLRIWVQGICGV